MVRMVPADYAKNANFGEKKVFNALQGVGDRDDWIAFHSLAATTNALSVMASSLGGVAGEGAFWAWAARADASQNAATTGPRRDTRAGCMSGGVRVVIGLGEPRGQ